MEIEYNFFLIQWKFFDRGLEILLRGNFMFKIFNYAIVMFLILRLSIQHPSNAV